MVAYGFQRRFVPSIERGDKTHTIRKPREGRVRHARPGGPVTLKTGSRFKPVILGRATCEATFCIRLEFVSGLVATRGQDVAGEPVGLWNEISTARGLERFAKADGFESFRDMAEFWMQVHSTTAFCGVMIKWRFPFDL